MDSIQKTAHGYGAVWIGHSQRTHIYNHLYKSTNRSLITGSYTISTHSFDRMIIWNHQSEKTKKTNIGNWAHSFMAHGMERSIVKRVVVVWRMTSTALRPWSAAAGACDCLSRWPIQRGKSRVVDGYDGFWGWPCGKSHLDVPKNLNQFAFPWVLLLRAKMLGHRYELLWSQDSQTVLVNHLAYLTSSRVLPLSTPARWGSLDFIRVTSSFRPSSPFFLPTANSRSQCALPDLNCELQISVGTAGPQPRAPDLSGHCRTSTTTSRSQWALPDLNCERQISEKATSPFEVVDGHEPKPETKCIFRDDEKTRRLDMEAGNWQ